MYKLQTTKLLSSNFLGIKVDQDCDQGTEWQKAGRQYQYHAPPRQCKSGSGPQGPTDQPTNSGIKETSLGNCTTGWGCLSVTEKTEFADGPWLRDSSWKTQEIWARVSESNRFQKQLPCLWLQKWSLCRSSIMTPILSPPFILAATGPFFSHSPGSMITTVAGQTAVNCKKRTENGSEARIMNLPPTLSVQWHFQEQIRNRTVAMGRDSQTGPEKWPPYCRSQGFTKPRKANALLGVEGLSFIPLRSRRIFISFSKSCGFSRTSPKNSSR